MTVAELIKALQEYPQDSLVIMSSDGEGNCFSPLADTSDGGYHAETTYDGVCGPLEITEEMKKDGYSDEDKLEDAVPVVCLWPTN